MKNIPIFYACDDAFVKYTIVSIKSMIENSSKNYSYTIYILNTGVSDQMVQKTLELENDNFKIKFTDVSSYLSRISKKFPLRDYYSKSTYFRLFIPDMFPHLDKAIYIDSDTVVLGDISELYNHDLGDNYLGGAREQAMVQEDVYGTYVEKVLGISRHAYFNAGLLLLNCKLFREHDMLTRFTELLNEYDFVVTQDEDYLNLMCKDRVLWLDSCWNAEVFGVLPCEEKDVKILHYIMVSKPWHYKDCRLGEYFWKYADMTSVGKEIRKILENYTDEQRQSDALSCQKLMQTAIDETVREDNYLNNLRKKQSADRVEILKKIEKLELEGKFDIDVENDPPTKPLTGDVDYTQKKFSSRLKSKIAFGAARIFVNNLLENKKMIVKDIVGVENFKSLKGGAIITCNHFNAFDSFAIQLAYDKVASKDHKFFRVVREGNYTSFPGFYGFLMKNCNTLPLCASVKGMQKFMQSVGELLNDGHYVLIYPEQSMWWNYRKPKPLKKGAYSIAAKNKVPVLPCFITMKDTDILGKDGFFVQEYTIHIGKPIYPKEGLSTSQNTEFLLNENYRVWKQIYEENYNIPLFYTCNQKQCNAI